MTRHWTLPLAVPSSQVLWGVEQEYQVRSGSRQLDFRKVLDEIGREMVCRDPGDPRARRLESGLGLTADGWEAELVTPPLDVSPFSLVQVGALLSTGEQQLAAVLGDARIEGFSTHLNVSVRDERSARIAEAFAWTCASLVNDLVEPFERSGVLVRPRRGRLEVGCEHLRGAPLLIALSIVAACARGLEIDVPAASTLHVVPSREKFGHFVPPDAMTASEPALLAWADTHLAALGLPPMREAALEWHVATAAGLATPFRRDADLGPRERHGWQLSCAWLTWRHSVWSVHDPQRGRTVYAVVPASAETEFVHRLDAGLMDDALSRALRSRRQRRLEVHRQIMGPGLWTDVRPGALVPTERLADGSLPRARHQRAFRARRAAGLSHT